MIRAIIMSGRMRALTRSLGLAAVLLAALAGCTLLGREPSDPWATYRPALAESVRYVLDTRNDWTQYFIDFDVDTTTNTIQGHQVTRVTNPSAQLWYDLYFRLFPNLPQLAGDMEVSNVTVNGESVPYTYAADRSALRLNLTEPLAPGSAVRVEFDFEVSYPAPTSDYVLFGEKSGIVNLPVAYPMLAVFDETAPASQTTPPWNLDAPAPFGDLAFSQSALYQVTATVPASFTVIATGTPLDRTDNQDGTNTWRWVSGPNREFMMTMGPDFQVRSTQAYSTTVNSYFLPGDEAAGEKALTYAAAALRVYHDTFGRYPYPQMDIVASPLEYRGMEYPGLDLLGIDLYRERQEDLEFLIAHEVAHQWWYNLVGSDPVRLPWLDEGLAEYSTYLYEEAVHGKAAADELLTTRWQIPVDYARRNGLDAPLDQPATAFAPGTYETMVYAKAALFFHAVRQTVGDDAFFRILRAYVARYRFDEANPAAFISMAEQMSGKSLQTIYQEWILAAAPAAQ